MGVLDMPLPIWDGPLRTGANLKEWAARGMLAHMAERAGMQVPALSNVSNVAEGSPLQAHVDLNRWIVDCPDCGCCEFVWPELLMMCAGCFNGGVGHKWRRVAYPAQREAIERVLMARPVPANRNWELHETVEMLKIENLQHGLPEEV